MIRDQKQYWNIFHQKGKADHATDGPSSFALEVQNIIPPQSSLLELGCGDGKDAFFFAEQGHSVLATDFSEIAIERNKSKYISDKFTFSVLDISKVTPYRDDSFDALYARLSLHYFTDTVTKAIFRELNRIVKPEGYLCFICKSTQDPLYGKGTKIEKDMFENNGNVRHFFSEAYVTECMVGNFSLEKLDRGKERFYDKPSAYIKVLARKK